MFNHTEAKLCGPQKLSGKVAKEMFPAPNDSKRMPPCPCTGLATRQLYPAELPLSIRYVPFQVTALSVLRRTPIWFRPAAHPARTTNK